MLTQSAPYSSRIMFVLLLFIATILLIVPELSWAQAGLTKTTSFFEKLRDWLWLIIPVACLIIGGLIGWAYSADLIRKDQLYTWIGGTIFAGLVSGAIVELVF